MKKITYNLQIGIIGNKEFAKKLLVNFLESQLQDSKFNAEEYKINGSVQFLFIFKGIPFTIKILLFSTLDDAIRAYERIQELNVLFLLMDVQKINSEQNFYKTQLKEIQNISLNDLSISLIGLEQDKDQLINSAKNLDILYCFMIQEENNNFMKILQTILKDFIFNFKYSSPELYERAKKYGNSLLKEGNSQLTL